MIASASLVFREHVRVAIDTHIVNYPFAHYFVFFGERLWLKNTYSISWITVTSDTHILRSVYLILVFQICCLGSYFIFLLFFLFQFFVVHICPIYAFMAWYKNSVTLLHQPEKKITKARASKMQTSICLTLMQSPLLIFPLLLMVHK